MIDKRVIERQIRKGKLDATAYQRTLEGLPDLSDRVARDTGEEPIRSAVVAAPSAPSASHSSGLDSEPDDLEDDEDEDEDDEEDDDDEGEDEATPETP